MGYFGRVTKISEQQGSHVADVSIFLLVCLFQSGGKGRRHPRQLKRDWVSIENGGGCPYPRRRRTWVGVS